MTTTQQQPRALGATPDSSAIAMRTGAAHADARNARVIAGDILDSARGRQRDEMESLVKAYEDGGDHRVTWNTPGLRAFLKREAHTEGDLKDWYQHSVDSTAEPVWTDKHIKEVVKDYWLIPKPIKEEKE